MHILKISSSKFQPEWNHMDGIFVKHQAEVLNKSDLNIGILSADILPFTKPFVEYNYEKEVLINDILILRKWERTFFPNLSIFRLLRVSQIVKIGMELFSLYVSKKGMPDVIHCHNALNAGYLGAHISIKYNIPLIITEHSSAYARGLINRYDNYFTKFAYNKSKLIISVSDAQAEILNKNFNIGKKVKVIPNVLNPLFEEKINVSGFYKNNKFTYLTVGTLDNNKNQRDIILAFSKILKHGDFELLIGGDGPKESELRNLVLNLKIDEKVVFLGKLMPKQVKDEMIKANVFISNSKFETFGVVIIEALSCGCVTIATNSGGPKDIINLDNGILLNGYDVEELSNKMLQIYYEYDNYDRINIANKCCDQFGSDEFIKKMQNNYKKIAQKNI